MGRIALVTGGSSGIGLAVAARLQRAGHTVVITGRDPARLESAARATGAEPVVCDGTDPGQVASMADALGPCLDVLVNNAGGNTDFTRPDPGSSLREVADAWWANLGANLLSAVLTTTAVLGRMRRGGSVISISSIAAEYATTSYGAAKAALAAWNAGLSEESAPLGVTANVIAPGFIADTGFFRGRLTDARRSALVGATHTGRAGHTGDIAETVLFLASPGARHITGQTLHVNGGAHTTR